MGTFYANVTVRTDDVAPLIEVVRSTGVDGSVASSGGFVVLADSRLDQQDEAWLAELTRRVSAAVDSPALGVLNHDDSVLMMSVADRGRTVTDYNSLPDYFTDEGGSRPTGGSGQAFVLLSPGTDTGRLEEVLNSAMPDDEAAEFEYAFETDRHAEMVSLLALPEWSVGFTHGGLHENPPTGFDKEWIVHRDVPQPRLPPVAPARRSWWARLFGR